LKHHTVETRDGCAERHRLGPFDTRAEAEQALQKVAERNERADAEDRAWERGGSGG
jgi:cell division protein FtsN